MGSKTRWFIESFLLHSAKRRMEKFELRQVSPGTKLALDERQQDERRICLGVSISLCILLKVGCFNDESWKFHKIVICGNSFSNKRFTGPESLASIKTSHFDRNKIWTTMSLNLHRRSDERRKIRLGDEHFPGIQRTLVFWKSNNPPGQCHMSFFTRI